VSHGTDEMSIESLDLTPSPRLLEVLGDIPYKPWQCLAELVDNAFDDFLYDRDRDPSDRPSVEITLPKAGTAEGDELVCVADNGRGMSLTQFERALRAGYSPNSRYGSLGLFGMGFNIATANLGSLTEVKTTRAGDPDWLVAEIDFREMQRRESFIVPLRREPKADPSMHGTEVAVRQLRPDKRAALRRQQVAATIREQLGKVYSYLLRSRNAVPELPETDLAGRGFALLVNGTAVRPRLPCVWSSSRTVPYHGAEVSAIQRIDRDLTPAWACQDCGHWNRGPAVERCAECRSDNLELRERRIVGWVGIQRYLSPSDFGIDFLRNGRKILISDRSVFEWENPDTGEKMVEYPIELGATQGGRIVGEIHLDHLEPTYQKNDFKRDSPDWMTALHEVRGEGPLQPQKARTLGYEVNNSPLGRLFHAYRRNDPGTKCLIPGGPSGALHEKARECATLFRKGLPEYMTDEKWYKAAQEYDEIKRGKHGQPPSAGGESSPGSNGPDQHGTESSDDILARTGLGMDEDRGEDVDGSADGTPQPPPQPPTEEQRYARYRQRARRLGDLSGVVSVAHLGRRTITVFDTPEPLIDHSGRATPCVSRTLRGNAIEVFVHGDHDVFKEFGRDPRDYAIIEIAEALRAVAATDDSVARVAAEVTEQFRDQRFTDAVLRERSNALLARIQDGVVRVGASLSAALWSTLPTEEKHAAERHAAGAEPRLVWQEATENGTFIPHLRPEGLAVLVRAHPALLLDGAVFSTTWSTWSDHAARNRQVERIARLLDTIGEFMANTSGKTRLELAMMRLTLEVVEGEISEEDIT
jgi:hypothetical protein